MTHSGERIESLKLESQQLFNRYQELAKALRQSRLQERVLAKGVMRSVMEQVQIDVLDHGQLALLGAAQYYREQFPRTL